MILNKLKPLIVAGTICLTGILGTNTAKAEPTKKVIPAPIVHEQEETAPHGQGLELLLTIGDIAASLITYKTLHDRYDNLTLADQASLIGHRKKILGLKTDHEYKNLSAVTDGLEWVIITGELTAALFTTIAIHEYGHAVTANIKGVDIADLQIMQRKRKDNTFSLGYTIYDSKTYNKKSKFEKVQIAAGGTIATRTVAEKLDKLMDATDLPPRLEQALATLYFMNRFDGTRYILECSIKAWTDTSISGSKDPQRMLNFVTGKNYEKTRKTDTVPTKEEKIAYAIATGVVVIDTLLDLKEIHTNLKRLWMMETDAEKENYSFNLIVTSGGLYANFTYQF